MASMQDNLKKVILNEFGVVDIKSVTFIDELPKDFKYEVVNQFVNVEDFVQYEQQAFIITDKFVRSLQFKYYEDCNWRKRYWIDEDSLMSGLEDKDEDAILVIGKKYRTDPYKVSVYNIKSLLSRYKSDYKSINDALDTFLKVKDKPKNYSITTVTIIE